MIPTTAILGIIALGIIALWQTLKFRWAHRLYLREVRVSRLAVATLERIPEDTKDRRKMVTLVLREIDEMRKEHRRVV